MKIKTLPSILFLILFFSILNALDGDMYDFFLPNGMKVILMEKHSTPKIGLGVYYNVGSHDEEWGQKGINPLIQDLVLEGTDKYPREEVTNKMYELAMGWGAYGSRDNRDITYYYSELPIEELEFGLDFESDRMKNIIITNDVLIDAKKKFKVRYDEYHDNYIWVTLKGGLSKLLPQEHPYKIDDYGIWEQIDSLSVKTCQQFYDQYYAPNNSVLVVVGNIIPEDATKLIYKYFGSIEPSEHLPPDPDFSFDKNTDGSVQEYFGKNKWDSMFESLMVINFFMPSARTDDAILIEHLENILHLDIESNGILNKKFTRNNTHPNILFVDDNFALGPSSFVVGGISILKKVSSNKFKKSVLATFKYLGENGVDNEMLDLYKKSELLKAYKKNNSYSHIANRLGQAEIINGDYNYYNKKIELLEQLTNEDIIRVVNAYFHENNMYAYTLTLNSHLKKWYTPIQAFFANVLFLFWNPFTET